MVHSGTIFYCRSLFNNDCHVGGSFLYIFFISYTFYVKEKVDYRKRKILFSTKGDYIHQLYTAVDKIGKTIKIDELLEKFAYEVSIHLELEDVLS